MTAHLVLGRLDYQALHRGYPNSAPDVAEPTMEAVKPQMLKSQLGQPSQWANLNKQQDP